MSNADRPRVLCVDDEPALLNGLRLVLNRHYRVHIASSGKEALALLEQDPDFAVIISDMRMPGMGGAEFLARACALAPQAQRMALTGESDLTSAISAINDGQIFRYLSKPCPPPQLLAAVQAAIERYNARALEQTSLRRKVEQQQLRIDPVTGLGSRLKVMEVLEAAANDSGPQDLMACYLEIARPGGAALEQDSAWNDRWPRVVADRLRAHDAQATLIARWDVQQFLVLRSAHGVGDLDLHVWGDSLRRIVAEPIRHDDHSWPVEVNLGIARLLDRNDWQELVPQAALAAREARRGRSGQVCIYRPETPLQSEREHALVRALRSAHDRQEISLHYQPIVDVRSGRLHALECLARWQHPEFGAIPPAEFIPLAEQHGQIHALGQWVLERACREVGAFVRQQRLKLAVNVSAKQFLQEEFPAQLIQCLTRTQLAPDCLELELTESALVADMEHLRRVLEQFRARKIRIAIDDFGTGQSSLAYLTRLPVDVIKVDRSFVRDFESGGKSVIRAALAMAEDFGCDVVIEGVESVSTLQQVRDLGASLIQGYWIARPMPVTQLKDWLLDFEGSHRERVISDSSAIAGG